MLYKSLKIQQQQSKRADEYDSFLRNSHRDLNPDLGLRWRGSIELSYGGG